MPKFEKEKVSESQKSQEFNQDFAFKSLIFTLLLGILFFILSILFNVVDIISLILASEGGLIIEIFNTAIKVLTSLAFFFFILTSIGNYKDLLGKPADWKEIAFLFCLSLFQTVRNTYAFGLTLLGLILMVFYFYIIQEI
jgi:Na+/serine symporter